ncbi:hypothetical protein ACFQ67_21090 [Streptomyces sp. NPDC056488]|uniref:hypothetical protein n=1 Tax=Streptomyces sp. NPDC056488 TaxID=3345836 RepID=UPI0036B4220A
MDRQVADVVRGFLSLTPTQQDELVTELNGYLQGGTLAKDRIRREATGTWGPITKVDLGPTTSHTCACCGR